jgi:hypothetical protein
VGTPLSILLGSALIAAAILITNHWGIVSTEGSDGQMQTLRLERSTGDVQICFLDAAELGSAQLLPIRTANISKLYRAVKVPAECSPYAVGQDAAQRAFANERELTMVGSKSFLALSIGAALGVLGATSAVASEHTDRGDRGGFVTPGSLDGVNPAYHPEIFRNPAVARSYGFVQSRDGIWHVQADWRGEAMQSRAEYRR